MQQQPSTYTYSTGYMTIKQLTKVIYYLKEVGVKTIKGRISCPSKQAIQYIQSSLFRKWDDHQTNKFNRVLQNANQYKSLGKVTNTYEEMIAAKSLRYKRVIDFSPSLVLHLYINQYRQRLRELGTEFNTYMIEQGKIIKVSSQQPISPILQSMIVSMKLQMVWRFFYDESFLTKLIYSKQISKQLNNLNVKFVMLRGKKCIILHTCDPLIDLRQIKNMFNYDVTILDFWNPFYSRYVNRIYFKMLLFHLGTVLARITEDYQIKIQINQKKLAIIVHNKDPVFYREPISILTQMLSKFIFVAYYTPNTKEHLTHMGKFGPKSNCFQASSSKDYIYTSWNRNKEIDPESIKVVYEKWLQQINLRSILRIGFRTGGLKHDLMQNVQDLAQKYKLHSSTTEYIEDKKSEVIHVKLKSFNQFNRKAKIRQLCCFLQELITGKQAICDKIHSNRQQDEQQEQVVLEEQEEVQFNNNMNEQVRKQNNQDLINNRNGAIDRNRPQNAMKIKPQSIDSAEKQDAIQVKNSSDRFALQYKLKLPCMILGDRLQIRTGSRDRQLQGIISDTYGLQSRAWQLSITLDTQTQQQQNGITPKFQAQNTICRMIPVEQYKIVQECMVEVEENKWVDWKHLQIGREYMLVSRVDEPELCVLTHKIIIYG